MVNSEIKKLAAGFYDLQHLRVEIGNRITAQWKAKAGQAPGQRESEIPEPDQKLLRRLRLSYRRLTDGLIKFPQPTDFVGDELIASYTELALVAMYLDLDAAESRHFKILSSVVEQEPIYAWLETVRGCGPTMAAVIISTIDIRKAKYVSSLWQYSGLSVAADGQGMSRKAEHLVKRVYLNREGKEAERLGITFNPFLKTKLIGVLGPCMIKAGDSPYVKIYRDYKHRLENHPAHKDKTKGHRNNMAIRYMIKAFLRDLYVQWRGLEGLPVHPPYAEAKLGISHGSSDTQSQTARQRVKANQLEAARQGTQAIQLAGACQED
jgi:hypothetical protein